MILVLVKNVLVVLFQRLHRKLTLASYGDDLFLNVINLHAKPEVPKESL